MESQNNDRIRERVRTAYAKVARGADGCGVGCCGNQGSGSLAMGYTQEDRESVPDGFELDATHQPHITTLQRYVHTGRTRPRL